MATYAIGDIQGCFSALNDLLHLISFSEEKDILWFTGDLVNRGPDSLSTIRLIHNLIQKKRAVTVLGNHDLSLLAVAFGKRTPHQEDTYQDILTAEDGEQLLHWLRAQPLMHTDVTLGYTLVHAGIPPQWNLSEALLYAQEIETLLQGPQYQHFLENMFGNDPTHWQLTHSGIWRSRYIVNALTRMRFCSREGELDLGTKGSATHPPIGLKPWFEWPHLAAQQTKIIFGHWAALQGHCAAQNIIALDTGCVWGGSLTAFCLETEERYSVACRI